MQESCLFCIKEKKNLSLTSNHSDSPRQSRGIVAQYMTKHNHLGNRNKNNNPTKQLIKRAHSELGLVLEAYGVKVL
jgi:hypothetical protein